MNNLEVILSQGASHFGLNLCKKQINTLLTYVDLLEKWNKKFNLTAVKSKEEMVTRHLLDSLSILKYMEGKNYLDVGSGAGLPGIPLAVVQPDSHITMTDCNGKKTRFITQSIIELGLKNAVVIQTRIENWYPNQLFDVIVSRAFSSISDMINKTAHLVTENSYWLTMKGTYPEKEIHQLTSANVKTVVKDIHKFSIPGCDGERHIVILKPGTNQSK